MDSIGSYFLGQTVSVKSFPEEKMERVVKVEVFDFEGAKEFEKLWFNYEHSDELKMYFRDASSGHKYETILFANLESKPSSEIINTLFNRESMTLFETLVSNALLAA